MTAYLNAATEAMNAATAEGEKIREQMAIVAAEAEKAIQRTDLILQQRFQWHGKTHLMNTTTGIMNDGMKNMNTEQQAAEPSAKSLQQNVVGRGIGF